MMTYDDRELTALFEDLSPTERLKALRGGFTKAANYVRRQARKNLRTATNTKGNTLHNADKLGRGIRRLVWKQKLGFRVTVGTGKKDQGMHTNQRGLKKPVLMWAESGTVERETKSTRRFYSRKKKGAFYEGKHSTGKMHRYGFMEKTLSEVQDKVSDMLHDSIITRIKKIAEKHGCK